MIKYINIIYKYAFITKIMFKQFSLKLVNKSNCGNPDHIELLLNTWLHREEESGRLDELKNTVKRLGEMGGELLIKHKYFDWHNTITNNCNYNDFMFDICHHIGATDSQIDNLLTLLINDVLLNYIMSLYPEAIDKGNMMMHFSNNKKTIITQINTNIYIYKKITIMQDPTREI